MADAQIRRVAETGRSDRRVGLHAPVSGVVAELGVREGTQVVPGMALFKLVDLSSVWVTAEIIENQTGWIAQGNCAEVRVAALPGKGVRRQRRLRVSRDHSGDANAESAHRSR